MFATLLHVAILLVTFLTLYSDSNGLTVSFSGTLNYGYDSPNQIVKEQKHH